MSSIHMYSIWLNKNVFLTVSGAQTAQKSNPTHDMKTKSKTKQQNKYQCNKRLERKQQIYIVVVLLKDWWLAWILTTHIKNMVIITELIKTKASILKALLHSSN